MKRLLLIAILMALRLDAYPVLAYNSTDAAIKLRVTGAGKDETIEIAPGQEGSIDFGGICPYYAQIRDAGKLATPPAPVEFHFSWINHCRGKELTVSRRDNYLDSNTGQSTVVNTGSGSVVAPTASIKSRQFIVQSNVPGAPTGGGAEVKEIISRV